MGTTRDDAGPMEPGHSNDTWWPSNSMERLRAVSLITAEETLSSSDFSTEQEGFTSHGASQTLWATGKLSEPIPNGFYSIVLASSYALVGMCKLQ